VTPILLFVTIVVDDFTSIKKSNAVFILFLTFF